MKRIISTLFFITLLCLLLCFTSCVGQPPQERPDLPNCESQGGQHTYTAWEASPKASCKGDGEEARICTVCYHRQTRVTSVGGRHNFSTDNVCLDCGYQLAPTYAYLNFSHRADDTCTVTLKDNCAGQDVVIPAYHDGDPVIKFSTDGTLFSYNSIYLPPTVTTLDIEYVRPESFEEYGGCLYLGDWLVGVSDKSVKTVTLKPSTIGIANNAFADCTELQSITLPNGLLYIKDGAFRNCAALRSVSLPDSVIALGYSVFYQCTSLEEVSINHRVTGLGMQLFNSCTNLKSFTIPEGITTIGDRIFEKCEGLTSLHIPSTVTKIGNSIVSSRSGVTELTVDENNPVYHSSGNCIIETATGRLIGGCRASVIPDDGSVTAIGNSAFSGCIGLTEITIPASVTVIENQAFYVCEDLTTVHGGEGLLTIGEHAFDTCFSMTSFTLPDGLVSIGQEAFFRVPRWTPFIPASVERIGYSAFYVGGKIHCAAPEKPSGWAAFWSTSGTRHWGCDGTDLSE